VYSVLSPGFFASYWSAGFGIFLQVSALASHWLEYCENFTPTPEKNEQYCVNHSEKTNTRRCFMFSRKKILLKKLMRAAKI
jgi:hypothetical protein